MRTSSHPNIHHSYPELDYNAFCQCAFEYSGNFYDFFPQESGRLAVSFGDLPSMGDTQSINVPCLQALVRGLTAGCADDLAALARELNGTLYLVGPQYLCAPWFYAQIDPLHHQLQYVNAGHEPPLLFRQNGTVRRLERTGAALGLSTRDAHRRQIIAIEPGDLLAIFSEAVPEEIVREVVCAYPHAGAAELTRHVQEECRQSWMGEDRSFAAIRMVDACRHPLPQERAEALVLCAA